MRKPWLNPKFWGLFALGLAIALFWCSPLAHRLLNPEQLIPHLQMNETEAIALFVLAHIVATVLGFPGSVLVIVGGAVFGLVWGTVWSVVGATSGAIAAFWLVRYLLKDWIERRFQHHDLFQRLKRIVQHRGFACVVMLRFVPISPFTLVNFAFGLTPIGLKPYALGTFLGIIPGTLLYSWLGVAGYRAAQGEGATAFILALSLLVVMSILPIIARQRDRHRST